MPSDARISSPATADAPGRWPQLLGVGGLLPFIGLALAIGLLPEPTRAQAAFALQAYGASILSFLGAIHWGLALREPGNLSVPALVWGVLPSLLAWIALLCTAIIGLWLLAAGLWACWAVDRSAYPRFGLRTWLGLRLQLTAVASACCVAGAVALVAQV